jgi:hypothetical protein
MAVKGRGIARERRRAEDEQPAFAASAHCEAGLAVGARAIACGARRTAHAGRAAAAALAAEQRARPGAAAQRSPPPQQPGLRLRGERADQAQPAEQRGQLQRGSCRAPGRRRCACRRHGRRIRGGEQGERFAAEQRPALQKRGGAARLRRQRLSARAVRGSPGRARRMPCMRQRERLHKRACPLLRPICKRYQAC